MLFAIASLLVWKPMIILCLNRRATIGNITVEAHIMRLRIEEGKTKKIPSTHWSVTLPRYIIHTSRERLQIL